jgi:hypothetical protein
MNATAQDTFNSPLKKQKVITVPTVSEQFFKRNDLKLMLEIYLCNLGKGCYVEKAVGNKVIYRCKGSQKGLCSCFVTIVRVKIKKEEYWRISELDLTHNACLFSESKPSFKMLKDDVDMVSVAGKATSIENVVNHAQASNQFTLSNKMGSKLMLYAKNKV